MRARMYVDGNYDTYSEANLVNEWQEIKTSYTASEDKVVQVGLRFYDNSGFDGAENVYIDDVTFIADAVVEPEPTQDPDPTPTPDPIEPSTYYKNAEGKTGFELKTALYNIIKNHTQKSYGDLWDFMATNSLDKYYENDTSILDMYSEIPSASETYNFTPVTNQCGNYSGEGSCYNREHSMPKSWFDDKYPMYTDIHHLFATDGYENGRRSNFPYGEVEFPTWTSDNGSKLGPGAASLGFTGTVFEPIDEFKGDFARGHLYMAVRYEDQIATWSANSTNADDVLDGTNTTVFEPWVLAMLKKWHTNDPVSKKEINRNNAASIFQGNRNPFIDHPEYVNEIWAD